MIEKNNLEFNLDNFKRMQSALNDLADLAELAEAENDEAVIGDVLEQLSSLQAEVKHGELEALLSGEVDANDAYLEACAASKDKMRELIRNERRLELCFEGFRFWDLRRWKADLNEPVYGISWNGNSYQKITVEERSYEDYMYCCPIPNSEILKYSNLIQNKGWK